MESQRKGSLRILSRFLPRAVGLTKYCTSADAGTVARGSMAALSSSILDMSSLRGLQLMQEKIVHEGQETKEMCLS